MPTYLVETILRPGVMYEVSAEEYDRLVAGNWLVGDPDRITPEVLDQELAAVVEDTQSLTRAAISEFMSAGAPDATADIAGVIRLAGDLGGTAAAPAVPALADKQDAATLDADTAELVDGSGATAEALRATFASPAAAVRSGSLAAADRPDVLRLGADDFTPASSTPLSKSATANQMNGWSLPPTTESGLTAPLHIPRSWRSVAVDLHYTSAVSSIGDVFFRLNGYDYDEGGSALNSQNTTTDRYVLAPAPTTAGAVYRERLDHALPVDGSRAQALEVYRFGSPASDTFPQNIILLGATVSKSPLTQLTSGGAHRGLGSGGWGLADSRVLVWFREGPDHAPTGGAGVIKAAWLADDDTLGASFTIADSGDPGVDLRDGGSIVMGDGRLGLMVVRRGTADGALLGLRFVYSDDDGETWSHADINVPDFSLWFNLYRYPASVGGDDEHGFYALGASYLAGGRTISALTTVDNGDTWTLQESMIGPADLGGALQATEPAMVRLGDTDRWLMAIRIDDGTSGDMYLATSTDMLTWTTYDSGIPVGANPPFLWHDATHGWVHWTVTARTEMSSREGGWLVERIADADAVWADPVAAFAATRWLKVAKPPSALGYIGQWVDAAGRLRGTICGNQTATTTADVYVLDLDRP